MTDAPSTLDESSRIYRPQEMEFFHMFFEYPGAKKDIPGIVKAVRKEGLKPSSPPVSQILSAARESVFLTGNWGLFESPHLPYVLVDFRKLLRDGFEVYEANANIANRVNTLLAFQKLESFSADLIDSANRNYNARRICSIDELTTVKSRFVYPSMKEMMKWGSSIGPHLVCEPFHPEFLVKGVIPLDYLNFSYLPRNLRL